MRLKFPATAEDLDTAFDNAIEAGVLERDSQSRKFWARSEFLASDVEGDEVVADWFYDALSDVYTRVPRKEGST